MHIREQRTSRISIFLSLVNFCTGTVPIYWARGVTKIQFTKPVLARSWDKQQNTEFTNFLDLDPQDSLN